MDLEAPVEDLDVMAIDKSCHSSPLYHRLNALRKKGSSCNFDIIVGGDKIPVHKFVISTKSKYFRAILMRGSVRQVELKDIDKDSVVMCVAYMYGEPVSACKSKWAGLVHAADMLGIDMLLKSIVSYLERKLNDKTFSEISSIASNNSLRGLRRKSVEFAASHFMDLSDMEELNHLDAEFLDELFSTEVRASESSKLMTLLDWTDHNTKQRHKTFDSCFRTLDLSKVAMSFRRFLLDNEPLIKDSWPNLRLITVSLLDSAGIQSEKVIESPVKNGILLYYGKSIGAYQFSCVSRETQPFRVALPTREFSAVYLPGYIYCFAQQAVFQISIATPGKFSNAVEKRKMQYDHGVQPTVVSDGRYIYAVLGSRCGHESCIEQYNPIADIWRCLTRGGGLSCHACVFFDGRIFCVGGAINGQPVTFVHSYRVDGNSWTEHQSLPVPRMSSTATVLGQSIYLIGGRESVDKPTNTNFVFDTRTDAWSSIAPLLHNRRGCGAFFILGDIYVCGGCNMPAFSPIERYNVASNMWEEIETPFSSDFDVICSTAVVLPCSH